MKKILHIQNTDKFIEPYNIFINKHFNPAFHDFNIRIIDGMRNLDYTSNNITYIKGYKGLLILYKKMLQSEKIILHSLPETRILLLLFLHPFLLKKCYWIIWGSDLYKFNERKSTLRQRTVEKIRSVVIKNLKGIITHIKGDYELAKQWYGAKGEYYYSFLYPSNLYKKYELSKINKYEDKKYIQIGNSADPSNNHIEIFDELFKFNDKNFAIICPLSYGNSHYAKVVIERGKELFGERFIPLTEFMPFDKYLEILAMVNVAIFNHKRQQAVGNITTLLSLGKKVYIRDDITTWKFCKDHGLKVYSLNKECQGIFRPMPDEMKKINIVRVKEQFSEKKLVKDWDKIFSSKV
ncbi:TDP-N-acetylfucosamine:lipid II N-acetylfucosaminyltransferase [Oceanobacillus sp. CF4.6]|uniref:TDP-N-acetylfucosamine:lipid II N-acetylfucosaminyltransferase n=1 Tax=Oceanobacillus sp. CF4.6 TaxID=3373080 RepID=UPI003EE4E4EE